MSRCRVTCSRRAPQVAVLALMSIGFAGCSADIPAAAIQNPTLLQSSCLAGGDRLGAGARRRAPGAAAVSAAALAVHEYQSRPAVAAMLRRSRIRRAGDRISGGGGGNGIVHAAAAQPRNHRHAWRRARLRRPTVWHGGTMIIVGTSDTLEASRKRYGVPSRAILQANGYGAARAIARPVAVHPAARVQWLRPPVVARAAAPQAPRQVARPSRAPSVHFVNHGETLMSISRQESHDGAELARQQPVAHAQLKLGTKLSSRVQGRGGRAPTARAVAAAAGGWRPSCSRPQPATAMARLPARAKRPAGQATDDAEDRSRPRRRQDRRRNQRAADVPLAGARPRHPGYGSKPTASQ